MAAALTSMTSLKNSALPRWETPRSPDRDTIGHEIINLAAKLGTPLMPWQQQVALVGGEVIVDPETGVLVPAYPEVVVTVMRQNGKTVLMLSWELQRLLLWKAWDAKPQHVAYTAQTGSDGRKKFTQDQIPLIRNSPLRPAVERFYRAADNTGMTMVNGGRLSVLATSEEAGHGSTIDLAVMDEIWGDEDMRREQAMVPAMATRHDRQKLMTSTAGDDSSTLLLAKQAAGRSAVADGKREGIAYFEWSADRDDDPEDPRTWRQNMPALGYTITERTVRQAYDEMTANPDLGLDEFKRAWLNIPKSSGDGRVIPAGAWAAVCGEVETSRRGVVFAADATTDGKSAAIAVADDSGRAELVEHHQGTGWVLDRLFTLAKEYRASVVLDSLGTLGHLADELEVRDVDVVAVGTREYAYHCSALFANIMDGQIRIRAHADLDHAIDIARKRKAGDAWVWARQDSSHDISPLVAVTLALGEAFKGRRDSLPLVAYR